MRKNTKNDPGLYPENGENPIPLLGVHVTGDVTGRGSRIRLIQRFRNAETIPIEAVYKFPLPENATVCGFRMRRADGVVIESSIEEREQAFELYDQAVADGNGAWLLDQERPNIFTLSVGNLNPGDEIAVEIDYVSLLESHGSEVRFFLPTAISPRYVPGDMPDNNGIPEEDHINPTFAGMVPYGLSIDVRISGMNGMEYLESPSHTIRQKNLGNAVSVEFTSDTVSMDRDFVLNIKYHEDIPCRAYAIQETRGTFVQVDFTPGKPDTSGSAHEMIFLLDCSGSMKGSSLTEAKRALGVALGAMEQGTYFNIYLFGSTFTKLFPRSMAYSRDTLDMAISRLEKVEANLGGTEIQPVLADVYQTPPREGMQRSILLLTDGEVGNEDAILELVAGKMKQARVFTIGVGHGPNEYFIRQTARSSGGGAEMIAPGERIEPKTLRLFQKMVTQFISSLRVTSDSAGIQSPATLTAFTGEMSSLFLKTDSREMPQTIRVCGRAGEEELEWRIPVVRLADTSAAIPILWAREAIRDLEDGSDGFSARGSRRSERKKGPSQQKAIELSTEYGILSRATSFVAVEKRPENCACHERAELRKVPVMLTKDWHGIDDRRNVRNSMVRFLLRDRSADFYLAPQPAASIPFPYCLSSDMPTFSSRRHACNSARVVPDDGFTPSASDSKMNLLLSILALQRAEGGFELTENVAEKLGLTISKTETVTNTNGSDMSTTGQIILETAIILEILEVYFKELEDTWRGVVDKSRNWLARELAGKKILITGQPMNQFVEKIVKGLSFTR
jgi:Ca-activated chloride channel family protein